MKFSLQVYLTTAMVAGGLCFGGCADSPSDDVKPASVSAQTDVTVMDGRLVFQDSDAYIRTLDKLKSMSAEELAGWEKGLKFSSLRTSVTEDDIALKEEFHFPAFIAAVINREGVYQAGDKLYWYDNHQLHEFTSLADLTLAQRGQKVTHQALEAGMIKLKAPVAERNTGASGPRDGKYQNEFCIGGNCGNRRKMVYETWAFYQQTPSPSSLKSYYTAVVFSAKMEFLSSRGWKPAGESRQVQVALNGRAESGYFGSALCANPVNVRYNGVTNSNVELTVGSCQFTGINPEIMYWNFTLNGTISSYVVGYPGQTYTVQGTNLW